VSSSREGNTAFDRRGVVVPAIRRMVVSIAVGVVAGTVAAFFLAWQAVVLIGWDAALVVLLGWIWRSIYPMTGADTEKFALREDPNRATADSVVVGAALAALVAVVLILVKATDASGGIRTFLITIGVVSVLLSWAAVHTIFTLRYAHLYYLGTPGGVQFHEDEPPDYVDFAYLALTIGMTFQVSDTDLSSKAIRRAALRHALISYLFGVLIIGLVINVVGNLLH
jgi:uncharacterized membrane protein